MDEFQVFMDVIDTLGTLGLLIWLVVQFRGDLRVEQLRHEETRHSYREDLREIAGVRNSLRNES